MTVWKRMLVFVVLACLVMALVPVSASAVDPVSAAVTANAFAQAVSAYGAAHGVSMSFDVANTDGIGEGVHELWESFLDDLAEDEDENLEDYESLPVTIIYTLFKKSSGSGGNNNNDDDDKVAVAISAATAAAFDKFWNWLLSGPAEMEKVDNQYYEWSLNQDGSVTPIEVVYLPLYEPLQYFQYDSSVHSAEELYAASNKLFKDHGTYVNTTFAACSVTSGNVYAFSISGTGRIVFLSQLNSMQVMSSSASLRRSNGQVTYGSGARYDVNTTYDSLYYKNINYSSNTIENYYIPVFASQDDGLNTYLAYFDDPTDDRIFVRPYIGDPEVQPITIPNPEDPDYVPAPVEIPLNIPWDPATFGDGDQDQDSDQVTATAAAVGTAILANPENALELEPAEEPSNPGDIPNEVYIPFLPVTLPSFNFNFSGIWHYVVEWIGSLGAWFNMVMTVWSNLPYAMTVPVYACLVILIVLGVYRRFLS